MRVTEQECKLSFVSQWSKRVVFFCQQRTLGPNRRQKFWCSLEAPDAPAALASSEISAPHGQQHRYVQPYSQTWCSLSKRGKKRLIVIVEIIITVLYILFSLYVFLQLWATAGTFISLSFFFMLLNAFTIYFC